MTSLGAKFGCAAAFLTTLVVSLPVLFVFGWGSSHCDPAPQCRRQVEIYFAIDAAAMLALAAVAGLILRWIVNRLAMRREDQGESAGFIIAAATMMLLVAGLAIVVSLRLFELVTTLRGPVG